MFGRKTRLGIGGAAAPSSPDIRHATEQFMRGLEITFRKFTEERPYFCKDGDWAITAKRDAAAGYENFWRHLEISFNAKPVALLDFRIIDSDLVGTIAIFDWNGMSVDDCEWLLFGTATMLSKPGLREYASARVGLRSTMNATAWNRASGAASSVCPRSSISVSMSDIEPLTTADWYHLDGLARISKAGHGIGS